jgi:hypothetical protein
MNASQNNSRAPRQGNAALSQTCWKSKRPKRLFQAVLESALELMARGIPVFPVLQNKIPACPHGFKDAATDIVSVKRLWAQYSAPLIGVPTGEASSLDVLDVDQRHGGDKWLATNASRIPSTRVHGTRSGGWHYLFKHHAGLRNSAGRIADGIDVRADGGYLIWWPASGLPVLSDVPLAPWPDWLLSMAVPPSPPPCHFSPLRRKSFVSNFQDLKMAAYARAALRSAYHAVSQASEGTRNDTLNRETWSLTRFVASGELSAQDVANALTAAALAAGLNHREVIATIASALRARGIA